MQRVPAANAVWAEDRILRFQHVDIGIAVAIEGGLLTPHLAPIDVGFMIPSIPVVLPDGSLQQ